MGIKYCQSDTFQSHTYSSPPRHVVVTQELYLLRIPKRFLVGSPSGPKEKMAILVVALVRYPPNPPRLVEHLWSDVF